MFFHKRPLIFVFRDTYSIYFKRLAYRLDSATRNPSNNLLLSTFVLWHIAPYYNQSFSLPFLFCVQAAYQLSIINYQFVVRSLYSVERIEGKQEFLPQRERRDTELHRERPCAERAADAQLSPLSLIVLLFFVFTIALVKIQSCYYDNFEREHCRVRAYSLNIE